MNIKLNKDFLTAYRNDFWKGFSIHELIYVGAGGLCGAASAALLYFKFHIDVTLSIYIGVPVAFPVILFGFYKYQGYLPVAQLLKEMLYTYQSRKLSYDSTEEKIKDKVFFIKKERERGRRN